mmetsp:Transcript_48628/g.136847  ORF Transcript_48628/g.136847 Transcript_48628/m.136847 type:complete len:213 (-) Transcript_48628:597-1235(-)
MVRQDRRGPISASAHGEDEPREAQDLIRCLSDRMLHKLHPRCPVPSPVRQLFGFSGRPNLRYVRHDLPRLLQARHPNLPRLHPNIFIYTNHRRDLHMVSVRPTRASAAGARISRACPSQGATCLLHADAHVPGPTDREPSPIQGLILFDARQWRAIPSCRHLRRVQRSNECRLPPDPGVRHSAHHNLPIHTDRVGVAALHSPPSAQPAGERS